MFTASFIGKKHVKKKMPCQDACASVKTSSGLEVLAVADGVSSSKFSEVAAQNAVKAVCDFWMRTEAFYTDSDSMKALMMTCFNYALKMSKSDDPEIKVPYGYETTLQAVVYIPEKKYCIMYVGDGGIYARKRDGKFSLLTGAMREEDGCVVPLSDGPSRWNYTEIAAGDIEQIAVVTDGVNDIVQSYGTEPIATLSEACGNIYVDDLKKILKKEPFSSIDDDITVCFTEKKSVKAIIEPQDGPIFPVIVPGKKPEENPWSKPPKKGKRDAAVRALLIALAIFAIAAIIIIMSLLKMLNGKDASDAPMTDDVITATDELQDINPEDKEESEDSEQSDGETNLSEVTQTRPSFIKPHTNSTEKTPEPVQTSPDGAAEESGAETARASQSDVAAEPQPEPLSTPPIGTSTEKAAETTPAPSQNSDGTAVESIEPAESEISNADDMLSI